MGSRADVLVVGGGLIGSSIAWRLAQRGIRVRLADAGGFSDTHPFLKGEASTAGAGMLSPGGEFSAPSPWVNLGVRSLGLYPDFVAQLHAETGVAFDFRVCGCLEIDTPIDTSRLEFQSRAGIRAEVHPRGVLYPDDALVDPAALLSGLRKALVQHGIEVETRRVSELESAEYAAVVIAAGAWSGMVRVASGGKLLDIPSTIPIKGHLIGYQMPGELLGPYLRSGHTYVLQRSDGFLIAGSTEEQVGFDTRVDPRICEDLHRRAGELVPELRNVQPARQWIGFRPGPELAAGPHIRRMRDSDEKLTNVWLAYGHYRNGILLTPLTAEVIAGEVAAKAMGS